MSNKSALAFLIALLIPGCGGNDSSPADAQIGSPAQPKAVTGAPASPSSPGAPANFTGDWDPSKGTATIRGAVKFSGGAPRQRPIDMGADAKCKALHATPLTDESVIVNANGTLKNSFVWIKKGLEGVKFPTPTEPVRLNQEGCRYVPHVLGIQVKQGLVIRNTDAFLHNVHSMAVKNQAWNFGQSTQGSESTKKFRRPEVMVKVKCDLHSWMSTYLGVVSHPFFAVTGDDGSFELKGLPPGKYTVEAWHEVYGTKTAEVTVADKDVQEITFTFEE